MYQYPQIGNIRSRVSINSLGHTLALHSLLRMVSLTISAAAKPPAFARSLPLTIDVKPEATVGEVKAAITTKFPKVRPDFSYLKKNSCHNYIH